ncbi:MAG: F-type H+-transporting ATPase subunit b [Candidatus Peregrinibacteria bacterium Greene0416_19]|nr:MAG: F-type H+-transporting ATPase subunit b [Candidatus Peregrinibacteria bacterium Greene0416_19]
MELLTKLGIDWKLLLAQIVNFTIVLGVLTYFVYRPLLDLLDRRRDRIAKAMEEVKQIEHQKAELDAFRLEQMRKIDEETGAFLERAKREAEAAGRKMVDEAKAEADRLLGRGRQQLEEERAKVFAEVQGTLVSMIVRMTEKILAREFTAKDQERIVSSLNKELPSLLR